MSNDFGTRFSNRLLMLERSSFIFVTIKSLAAAVLSLIICAFSLVTIYFSTQLMMENKGINFLPQSSLLEWVIGNILVYMTAAIWGVAVAILFRSTFISIVVDFAYLAIIEESIVAIFPAVGKWLPCGAQYAMLQAPPELSGISDVLDMLPGLGVYVLYLLVIFAVALVVLRRFTQPLVIKSVSELFSRNHKTTIPTER